MLVRLEFHGVWLRILGDPFPLTLILRQGFRSRQEAMARQDGGQAVSGGENPGGWEWTGSFSVGTGLKLQAGRTGGSGGTRFCIPINESRVVC
jgi:hypothetical protein